MLDSTAVRHLVRSIFARPELTRSQMAAACRVDVATFESWCVGRTCPPEEVIPLLREMAGAQDALSAADRWWAHGVAVEDASLRIG